MEIKVIRVYLSGAKRINELYEEKQQAILKQEELRRAVRAQDRQMKGYGKDFEALLREKEMLQKTVQEQEIMLKNMDDQMDKWERMYMQSEEARKSLGEKLKRTMDALELVKEQWGTPHPSAAQTPAELGTSHASRASGSPQGEGKRAAEGIATREERATNKASLGPCGELGAMRPMEGGAPA